MKFSEQSPAGRAQAMAAYVGKPQEPTRAEQELPELFQSDLLAGESVATGAKVAPAILTATNPQEMAQILSVNFPGIGIQYDEQGNILAANNRTGQRAILNRPGISGMDMLQMLGIGAAFYPAGRIGTVTGKALPALTDIAAAIAAGTATETGLQAIQAGAGGEFDTGEIALSGVLQAGGKALEGVVGSGYRAYKGTTPPEQAAIIRSGQEMNVPVMTSDIVETTTWPGKAARSTAEKIPVAGTGGPRYKQQEARQAALQTFMEKYQSPSHEEIISSLQTKSRGIRRAAGNVMQSAGIKLDDVGEIPVTKTQEALANALEALSKPNVRSDPQAIAELQTLSELMSMPQTFTTLKENRTIFRDILESFGKGERSQLPSRSKALLTKAYQGMSDDMDQFAKDSLDPREYQQWKRANAIYFDEAKKLKKSRIKNVLDKGDVTPESVETMLFSKKPSEVKAIYDSLTARGRENARAALIHRAYDRVLTRAQGPTPTTFVNELNKLLKQTDVFFKGENKKQLEGFKRLMSATRRAQEAAVETPTGQQMIVPSAAGYGAATDPMLTLTGLGTAGVLARIYESPIVRNAMIRLGSVPKGSDTFQRALTEVQAALVSTAQAMRSQQSE
jgi:hypothetical protein